MTQLDQIFANGQMAYIAHLKRRLPPEPLPFGIASLNIVTRDDFVRHTEICLDFITSMKSLHVLADDGSVFALLCRHRVRLA